MEAVIIALIPVILECIQARGETRTRESLRNPGGREYRQILRALRTERGLHGRKLRAEANELFAALEEASEADIDDLLEEAGQ